MLGKETLLITPTENFKDAHIIVTVGYDANSGKYGFICNRAGGCAVGSVDKIPVVSGMSQDYSDYQDLYIMGITSATTNLSSTTYKTFHINRDEGYMHENEDYVATEAYINGNRFGAMTLQEIVNSYDAYGNGILSSYGLNLEYFPETVGKKVGLTFAPPPLYYLDPETLQKIS